MKQIDQYKLTVNRFTTELDKQLNENQRSVIMTEIEIYETAYRDKHDGTYDLIYKSKVNGATEIKQGGVLAKGKSKRTQSKKLRQAIWAINGEEEFYQIQMDKIIVNIEEVVEFLKDK